MMNLSKAQIEKKMDVWGRPGTGWQCWADQAVCRSSFGNQDVMKTKLIVTDPNSQNLQLYDKIQCCRSDQIKKNLMFGVDLAQAGSGLQTELTLQAEFW